MDMRSSLFSKSSDLLMGQDRIVLMVGDRDKARSLLSSSVNDIAMLAWSMRRKLCEIRWDLGTRGYEVYASVIEPPREPDPEPGESLDQKLSRWSKLISGGYKQTMDFLGEAYEDGKIVVITCDVTDRCLHTNSRLKPSRAIWHSSRFAGYNYIESWRKNQCDEAKTLTREHGGLVNPQFFDLRSRLIKDAIVDFEYTLFRPPSDEELFGAQCLYRTTFLRSMLDEKPVRIGISDPSAFEVIKEAVPRP